MLAIHFDNQLYLNLRRCNNAGEFKTQAQNPDAYHVLKSRSLTNAFLHSEDLGCCLYKLLDGITVVIPSLGNWVINKGSQKRLREYRYRNFETLKNINYDVAVPLPDVKNAQPLKVLVYENGFFTSFDAWKIHEFSTKKENLIASISRSLIHRKKDTLYLKSKPCPRWEKELQSIGLKPQFTQLDSEIWRVEII